ncbi:MAG: hypothetical protein IKO05_05740 [Selenomonadaceae bacterium]|nr:hypothetical protein [Selenomonadaceae bacterium]
MNLSWILIFVCAGVCGGIAFNSYRNAQKKILDSGAQHVVTVGVLFTFIGIAYGLYNFDTNAANMVESINAFLDGMRLAFVTSIVGMGAGLAIKFYQRDIDHADSDSVKGTLEKILAAIETGNAANDNLNLQRELGRLVTAMETFAPDMKNLSAAMNAQSESLSNLSATLAGSIEAFGQSQAARLDAMKNSFDSFMRDVAKNFSENFIAALNESIKNLNVQLQTQFGENFKELNAAVREVVTWQREYKNIVELTTAELKVINETFNREILGALQNSLQIFSDTSAANISVQQELYAATAQLSKVISQAEESINQMQTLTENFGRFSEDALNKNLSVLRNHPGNIDSLAKNFAAEVKKINSVAQSVSLDKQHYLKDFNDTSAKSMEVIRKTIASFKADLDKETKESLSTLHRLFETVAKNTDEQSGKAIQNLAAALAEISGKLVSNYQIFISRIVELDKLLLERRRAG